MERHLLVLSVERQLLFFPGERQWTFLHVERVCIFLSVVISFFGQTVNTCISSYAQTIKISPSGEREYFLMRRDVYVSPCGGTTISSHGKLLNIYFVV